MVVLAAMTILAYLPSLNGDFIYDDHNQIVRNEKIHDPSKPVDVVFNGLRQIRVWQNLSFALSWAVSGPESWAFKVTNLFFHFLNAILLFMILRRFHLREVAGFAAALFLLHPLQTESIAYAMGLVSPLQTLFYFSAILYYLDTEGRKPWAIAAILLAALLAKESTILIPFVLLWAELTLFGRRWSEVPWRRFAIYFSTVFLFLPLRFFLNDPQDMLLGTSGFGLYPFGDYLAHQLANHIFYLRLLFDPTAQSIFHPYSVPTTETWIEAGLVILVILGFVYAWFRRRELVTPAIWFWMGFFVLSLAPTNGLLQMKNPFAEYRLYQANASVFALFSMGLVRSITLRPARKAAMLAILALALMGTSQRTRLWKDSLDVYSQALERYPDSPEIMIHVAVELDRRKHHLEARKLYLRAVEAQASHHTPSALALFRLARNYALTDEAEKAIETLDKLPVDQWRFTDSPPIEYYQLKLDMLEKLQRDEDLQKTREEALRYFAPEDLDRGKKK